MLKSTFCFSVHGNMSTVEPPCCLATQYIQSPLCATMEWCQNACVLYLQPIFSFTAARGNHRCFQAFLVIRPQCWSSYSDLANALFCHRCVVVGFGLAFSAVPPFWWVVGRIVRTIERRNIGASFPCSCGAYKWGLQRVCLSHRSWFVSSIHRIFIQSVCDDTEYCGLHRHTCFSGSWCVLPQHNVMCFCIVCDK